MVTQKDSTPGSAVDKLDHVSPATIGRELHVLADAFLAMGDLELEPTLLSVGLQVTGTQHPLERVATVSALAKRLGLTLHIAGTPGGAYEFFAGTFVRGPMVYTAAVPFEDFQRVHDAAAELPTLELDSPALTAASSDAPADLKAVAAVCCGQVATACFEVYTPREGERRGRLDGYVLVCDEHPREVAAYARAQHLVPYLVPLSKGMLREAPRCGDGYDYLAGAALCAPSCSPAESTHVGLVTVP